MKTTVEDCFELDMAFLKKEGYLARSSTGKMTWNCLYYAREALVRSFVASTRKISVVLNGVETAYEMNSLGCVYGGRKWFFLCHFCHRRARKLYLPPEGTVFACRFCHELPYLLQVSHRSAFYEEVRVIKAWKKLEKTLYKNSASP